MSDKMREAAEVAVIDLREFQRMNPGFLSTGLLLLEEALAEQPAQGEAVVNVMEAQKLRAAVKLAYGHLWSINDEPTAPIPLRSCEQASNAARHALKDALTMGERGQAIAEVRAMLASVPEVPR